MPTSGTTLRRSTPSSNNSYALINLCSCPTLTTHQAEQISQILPSHPDVTTATSYLAPLLSTYDDVAYTGMETAIFPHYFHGKCARDGADPPGCPNPDCPVVCGTPGSMVHFFPTLRFIAYNETRARIEAAVAPGSDAYQQVEQNVLGAVGDHWRRASLGRIMPRSPSKSTSKSSAKGSTPKKYKAYKTAAVLAAAVSSSSSAAPTSSTAPQVASAAAPDNHIFVPVLAREDLMNALSGADVSQLSALNPIGAGQLDSVGTSQLDSLGAGQLIPRKATATKTITAHALASTTPVTDLSAAPAPAMPASPDDHIFVPLARSPDDDIKDQLRAIVAQASAILGQVCDDNGDGDSADNLSNCSWEMAMKEYILTFP